MTTLATLLVTTSVIGITSERDDLIHVPSEQPQQAAMNLDDHAGDALPPRFGASGSWRWNMTTGGALDLSDSRNRLVQAGTGFSYFIVDDLSFDAELNFMYFDQVGPDAVGLNLNLSFRHHLIVQDNWSMYLDAGAGLMGLTERVPEDGTRFNFQPHAGGGFSFAIGNNARLLTGVRWHHISNANTSRNNPGRDSLLGYISISFPF